MIRKASRFWLKMCVLSARIWLKMSHISLKTPSKHSLDISSAVMLTPPLLSLGPLSKMSSSFTLTNLNPDRWQFYKVNLSPCSNICYKFTFQKNESRPTLACERQVSLSRMHLFTCGLFQTDVSSTAVPVSCCYCPSVFETCCWPKM